MAENTDQIQHFEVCNDDILLRFSCSNYKKRINACIKNLHVRYPHTRRTLRKKGWGNGRLSKLKDTLSRKEAYYHSDDPTVRFRLSGSDSTQGWNTSSNIAHWDAFFFENTDYPVLAAQKHDGIKLIRLEIGKGHSDQVDADEGQIFGSINYKNQVGRTDIQVIYEKDEKEHALCFTAEVLSYKMDYREDLRSVIRDIEEEFAMLSYDFLKKTYLSCRTDPKADTSDLIWWQIFKGCFEKICEATQQILYNPKRRLHTEVRYERAERMPFMPAGLECEYAEFEHDPTHLYRNEELFLSKDTIENRFLKYAIHYIRDRFDGIKQNILSLVRADNTSLRDEISHMGNELDAMANDPFFRGIGDFNGFSQDSLVMQQAVGYRDIYEQWIILQCGYDLQEGVRSLEVKDISALYEIWCFIKVKNIVQHILRDTADIQSEGKKLSGGFIKKLIEGKQSKVSFVERGNPDITLAAVMYNATTDDEENNFNTDESTISNKTDIDNTTSKTTEQRPDIVLQLCKSTENLTYTYLFDAKYRLRETRIGNSNTKVEVPPVDAINQLHRYRDAIYYAQPNNPLKKEVIGGCVLYPGNLSKSQFKGSYYYESMETIGIGAFPLKPGGHWKQQTDTSLINSDSSEDLLYQKIKNWIEDPVPQKTLLNNSIPQKGLIYSEDKAVLGWVFFSTIDSKVNDNTQELLNGSGKTFVSGYSAINQNINLQRVEHLAIVDNHKVSGYYDVERVTIKDLSETLNKSKESRFAPNYKGYEKPYRLGFKLGEYHILETPFTYGDNNASAGVEVSPERFKDYCEGKYEKK